MKIIHWYYLNQKLKKEVNEISLNKRVSNKEQYEEKGNLNISLPKFVEKKSKESKKKY